MSVPAWPMPTHQTKLTMAQPQKTGLLRPHTPGPFNTRKAMAMPSTPSSDSAIEKAKNHAAGVFFSVCTATISVMSWNERLPATSGASSSVFMSPACPPSPCATCWRGRRRS